MNYSYILHTPEKNIKITEALPLFEVGEKKIALAPYSAEISTKDKNGYTVVEVTVSAENDADVYLSLMGEGDAEFYSFAGLCKNERIFRQSPHDAGNYHFKMEQSAIPMVAAVTEGGTDIFISDNPSYFENATTQHIIPEEKAFYLSSGDKGGAPNNPTSDPFSPIFHHIDKDKTHTFRFIALKSDAKNLKSIRLAAYLAIEKVWGIGSDSPYRAMCFACNYMHIRKNETGRSDKWVVAGIEYANAQYVRDAYYQTMILDKDTQEQSYLALNHELKNAENPLIYLIWSYRNTQNGKPIDKQKLDHAFQNVLLGMEKYEPHDAYYPQCQPGGDFRSWFDTCAFAHDDIDLYNQSLLICALESAKRLGYDVSDRKEKALHRYHALFNGRFFPLSAKKQCLALDFTVGEVIHYLLFDELFIDQKMFEMSYRKVCDGPAKTPYGIKIIAAEDGSFLPVDILANGDYLNEAYPKIDEGRYHRGGSWHLYEMLFHIAGHLHGMPDAEQNLIDRLFIDLDYGGATYEYNHTIRGNGVKANQGWNAAIWAIWNELIEKGKATPRFFKEADKKLANI